MTKPGFKDPKLGFIDVQTGGPFQMVHNRIVAAIAALMADEWNGRVNYDHIKTTIPKAKIPLEYGDRRADIAVAIGPHHIVLIEVALKECAQSLEHLE